MTTENFVKLINKKVYKVKGISIAINVPYIQNTKYMFANGRNVNKDVLTNIESLLRDYINHIDNFIDDKLKPSELFTLVPFNKSYFKKISYIRLLPQEELTSQYAIDMLKLYLRDVKEHTLNAISPISDIKYRIRLENVTTSL
jgi:hypothetical protein